MKLHERVPEGICHFRCRCRLAFRCYISKVLIEDFLLLAMYCNVCRTVTSYMTFVLDIVQGFESVSNTSLKLNLLCHQLCMKFPAGGVGGDENSSCCQMMAETVSFSKTWALKETQNDGMCLKCHAVCCNTLS